MSTFTGDGKNARGKQASVDKDNPTAEEIKAAEATAEDAGEVPADDPNKPTEILNETDGEAADRHVASTELPVKDVTPPETQGDTPLTEQTEDDIVPGAAVGPDDAGVVRNDFGKVAHAPPGSLDAAFNGVQQDASGHVDSVGTDNSDRSGVRI